VTNDPYGLYFEILTEAHRLARRAAVTELFTAGGQGHCALVASPACTGPLAGGFRGKIA
jgi:hypothetical protein